MGTQVKIFYREYKSALNKLKYPDSWFWARYTINPYSGCAHTCIYCDARSQRYYLEQDFEHEIIVKINLDKNLDQTLKRSKKLLPDVVGPGGVTDAYQPIEKEVENTRKILLVLEKYKFPVNIATKSSLITRDLDILKNIARETWCTIGFSLTTMNQDLASFLEPYSTPPDERLRAMRKVKQEAPNIQVGTYMIPIIPFLEDDEENIEQVIRQSKQAGADFVLFSPGLTMRDDQANFFIRKLQASQYKDVVKRLLNLYKGSIYPPADYARIMHDKLYGLCAKYELPIRIKRWIPKDYRKWNYIIAEFLLNKEYEQAIKSGKSDNTMKWAGLNLNNLGESILDAYKRGALSQLKNFNQKIVNLVEPMLKNSKDLTEEKGIDKFL
jgi:DNA repair photolyase